MKKIHKIFFAVVILLTVGLDQLVKYLSVVFLKPIDTFPIIRNVFHLTYCENTGAAFSMLSGARIFFIVITAVFIVFLVWLIYSDRVQNVGAAYTMAIISAGGIGNLIDRILNGYVVDMFDFRLINFAIFNVADIAVTCGAAAFLIIYIVKKGNVIKWKK